jgi:hypothetical protein
MKRIIAGLGFSVCLAPLAVAQSIPEPLSFTGAPSTDSTAMVDLSARFGFLDENINGANINSNLDSFLFEGRFQVNQQVSFYGLLPLVNLSTETNIGGVVLQTDDTALGNPEIGGLFSLAVGGNATAAFGLGLGIPVLDGGDIAALGGIATNDINAVLYAADTLAFRPHLRFGAESGILSAQALLGLDLGLGVDNNNDDLAILRGGLNGGVAVVPNLSLMAEITFATDLDDNGLDLATLHLGGRGQFKNGRNLFQPAFEFFLPLANDLNDFVEFGFSLSLRATL